MSKQVLFRLSDDEHQALTEMAEAAEQSLPQFVKMISLNAISTGDITQSDSKSDIKPEMISNIDSSDINCLPFREYTIDQTPEETISEIAEALVNRQLQTNKEVKRNPYRLIQLACNYYHKGLQLTPTKGNL